MLLALNSYGAAERAKKDLDKGTHFQAGTDGNRIPMTSPPLHNSMIKYKCF